jgi:hypothetical protein
MTYRTNVGGDMAKRSEYWEEDVGMRAKNAVSKQEEMLAVD